MVFWVCGNYIPRLVTLTLIDLQGHSSCSCLKRSAGRSKEGCELVKLCRNNRSGPLFETH